jgi:hypothetical protein
MKKFYEPIKTSSATGKTCSAKITIPSWVILAKVYEFEVDATGRLVYTPVVD